MPLTFTHTGCLHLDDESYSTINPSTGVPGAWESHERTLKHAVDEAVHGRHDLFLISGDLFTSGRPTAEVVLRAADLLRPALRHMPLAIIGGDHDERDVARSQRTALHTLQRILTAQADHPVHLVTGQPQLVHAGGLQILALPWPSPQRILEARGATDLSPREAAALVSDHIRAQLQGLAETADPTAPLVAAGHLVLDGASRASDTDLSHPFGEPSLPAAALDDLPISYAALSHLHTRQRVGRAGHYCGSPDRFTVADADVPKSVNSVTIGDDNVVLDVLHTPTPARPMVRIDLAAPDARALLEDLPDGAIVAIRTRPDDPTLSDQERAAIQAAHATVVNTRVRPSRTRSTTSSVTAAAVPEGGSVEDALRAWHATRQPDGVDLNELQQLARRIIEGP